MMGSAIETDYLIMGAGAVGIGFADVLVAETKASVVIVDRRHAPGGHWNDAYPFVRLHHPSHYYGVHSTRLGDLSVQPAGLNKGLLHMATGAELVAYYGDVLQRQLLASGRVTYFPMSDFDGVGKITSLTTGATTDVVVRKRIVDATISGTTVPSTHTRNFTVDPGITCIPLNDLTRVSQPPAGGYCVIGSGKTGMDACTWLLGQGVTADMIRWVMPRDAWWIDRAGAQFTEDFFANSVTNIAGQMEALGEASSIDDLFVRLEACGGLLRLDPAVQPTMFHGATVARSELEQLRTIKDIVRLGRVKHIAADRIDLERGSVPAKADVLYVDCSAAGFARRKPEPVFQDKRIALQMLKSFQPTFSAAMIAHVEAAYDNDAKKNELCMPVPTPKHATDWLRMMAASMTNQNRWASEPALMAWVLGCRLDPMTALMRNVKETDTEKIALLQRSRKAMRPAVANLQKLMGELHGKSSSGRLMLIIGVRHFSARILFSPSSLPRSS